MPKASPDITAIICTRYRADKVINAVKSILLNDYPSFELILVDQSEGNRIEKGLHQFLHNHRFRHIKSTTKGEATARNVGVEHANSELLALTDDDCEASSDWLRGIVSAFEKNPEISIVLGNILPYPHDRNLGFIPTYTVKEPFTARGIGEKHRVEGASACMGLKKRTWQALGGFDRSFGPGTPLKAATDADFIVRALLSGHPVHETPDASVVHNWFRNWEEGNALIQGYLYGYGAMFAKNLKCGHWPVFIVLLHLFFRWAFSKPAVYFGPRPSRLIRLSAFLRGAFAGFRMPVDRGTGHFIRCCIKN